MVAVVSGNGLGLFNTSLTALGGLQGGLAGIGGRAGSQVVNITNGNLILQDQDENLTVRGFNTGVLRTYNSRGSVAGMGQDGWMTGYERRVSLTTGTLNQAGSQMTLYTGDGQAQIFTYTSSNTYTSTDGEGAHDSLVWNGTTWTFTEGSSRREEQYASHADAGLLGRLIRIRDLKSDGTTPAEFDVIYSDNTASARIIEIRSIDGAGTGADAILFGYDGSNRLISITTREGGSTKGQVSYGYDAYDRLAWVQQDLTPLNSADNTWDSGTLANNNGLRFRTTYSYVTTSASDLRIASVSQSDGTTVGYTYESDGAGGYRVKTVTQGNASDGSVQTVTFTYNANSTDVTDGLNRTWTYQYDANKQLTVILAPAINGQRDTTTYTYDASGNVTQVKTVSGATTLSQTDQSFDANGNLLWQWTRVDGANASSIAVQRTYSSTNQLLTETRYTGLDVDGPVATQLPTGGLTANFIYDAQNRLRFTVDATGVVTERTYATSGNGIGQIASSRSYTGALYSGAYTESALSTWATTTQKSNSQLTEFVYDAKGRLQQSVSFASVDGSGVGVASDLANDISRYNYDAQGLLLQKITVRGATRSTDAAQVTPATSQVIDYVYDGMGRLLSMLARDAGTAPLVNNPTAQQITDFDRATVSTTYIYADSLRQIVVTLDSGATRTETHNQAGQITSMAQSGIVSGSTVTRTTQMFYDAAGQLRGSEDASGARRYFFYDDKGRLDAEVDATGAVTHYVYDGADRRISTLQYANRVTTTSWLSGGVVSINKLIYQDTAPTLTAGQAWVQSDSNNDRTSINTFDLACRLLTQTDGSATNANRQITNYTYDAAGRVSLVSTTDKDGNNARVIRQLYDAAGRVIAKVDAENYVTEFTYDSGGRLIATVAYATATTTPTATTLAALRPVTNATNDQTTRYFYNGRGQQIGSLDALGYFSEAIIDEAGNTRAERRYAKQLTGLTGSETFSALKLSATTGAPSEPYRETKLAYNSLGQLVTQTNHELTVTRFTYDEAGRLVRTQTAENTSEVREGFKRYNVFDELIGEITGEQVAKAYDDLTLNLNGLLLNDPLLLESKLDLAYSRYGMTHKYDALGRCIESIGPKGIDAEGDKTFYFYDSQGRQTFVVRGVAQDNTGVTGLKNSYGEITETRYSVFGQVTDSITYGGRITIATPGDRNSVQSVIATLNTLTYMTNSATRRQFVYDQRGLLKQSIDALSINNTYSYNAFGQLLSQVSGVGTSAAVTTSNAYNNRGLMTQRTDGFGTSLARSSSQTFDAFGRTITSTDARGVVSTSTYDRLGRQLARSVTVTSEGGARAETFSTAYDAFSRTTSITDALNNTTTYGYVDNTRTMTVASPEGLVITTVHNRHGQTLTVKDPANVVVSTLTYDKNGNVITSTNALNQTTSYAYDVLRGLLVETTDASGRKVAYTYDAVGRVLSRIEDAAGLNLMSTTQFDGQGRQVKVTDASGRVTTMSYDQEGRLLTMVQDPSGLNLVTQYSYDALGHQITLTEGAGTAAARTVQYVYDALGRRTQEISAPGSLNLTTTYLYDANNNVVQRTDAKGQVARFVYDESNRRIYDINAVGSVNKTVYDADGRIIAVRSYATAINVSDLSTTVGINASVIKTRVDAIANEAIDQIRYQVYDRDSRVRFTISNLNATRASISEQRFDSAGRVSQSLAYVTELTDTVVLGKIKNGTAVFTDFATFTTANEAGAQRQSQVYDTAGRLRFSIDALGNVTEQRYDPAGRTIQSIAYAVVLSDSVLLGKAKAGTATVAEFTSFVTSNAATAQVQCSIFDGAGRLRFSVDALGDVTEQRYDASGRVTETLAYTVALTSTVLISTQN